MRTCRRSRLVRARCASAAITSITASAASVRLPHVATIVMSIVKDTGTSLAARARTTAIIRVRPSLPATRANAVPAITVGYKATTAISHAATSDSPRTVLEQIVRLAAASIPMSIARRGRKAARNGPGAGLAAVAAGAALSVGRTDRIG